MKNTKSAVKSIIPSNLRKNKLIKEVMDIVCDFVWEKSSVAVEISELFKKTNKVTFNEILQVYMKNYFDCITRNNNNPELLKQIRDAHRRAKHKNWDSIKLDIDILKTSSNDIPFYKKLMIKSGTFEGLTEMYHKINNFKIEEGILATSDFFEIEEGPENLTYIARGEMLEEIWENYVKILAHPVGWIYSYIRTYLLQFEDYFLSKRVFDVRYFKIICKGEEKDDYLLNRDFKNGLKIVGNATIKSIEQNPFKITFESGEYLVEDDVVRLYSRNHKLLKEYPDTCSISIDYDSHVETAIRDEVKFRSDFGLNETLGRFATIGYENNFLGNFKLGSPYLLENKINAFSRVTNGDTKVVNWSAPIVYTIVQLNNREETYIYFLLSDTEIVKDIFIIELDNESIVVRPKNMTLKKELEQTRSFTNIHHEMVKDILDVSDYKEKLRHTLYVRIKSKTLDNRVHKLRIRNKDLEVLDEREFRAERYISTYKDAYDLSETNRLWYELLIENERSRARLDKQAVRIDRDFRLFPLEQTSLKPNLKFAQNKSDLEYHDILLTDQTDKKYQWHKKSDYIRSTMDFGAQFFHTNLFENHAGEFNVNGINLDDMYLKKSELQSDLTTGTTLHRPTLKGSSGGFIRDDFEFNANLGYAVDVEYDFDKEFQDKFHFRDHFNISYLGYYMNLWGWKSHYVDMYDKEWYIEGLWSENRNEGISEYPITIDDGEMYFKTLDDYRLLQDKVQTFDDVKWFDVNINNITKKPPYPSHKLNNLRTYYVSRALGAGEYEHEEGAVSDYPQDVFQGRARKIDVDLKNLEYSLKLGDGIFVERVQAEVFDTDIKEFVYKEISPQDKYKAGTIIELACYPFPNDEIKIERFFQLEKPFNLKWRTIRDLPASLERGKNKRYKVFSTNNYYKLGKLIEFHPTHELANLLEICKCNLSDEYRTFGVFSGSKEVDQIRNRFKIRLRFKIYDDTRISFKLNHKGQEIPDK